MAKQKKETDFKMEIGDPKGREWSPEKIAKIKEFAKDIHRNRTPEQLRRNAMAAIRYKMEEYANTEEDKIDKELTIEYFVVLYLDSLELNFKTFARAIDSNDANLKKYLKGERKFNEDLACRFGKFFHVSPLTWMKVQHKNDLLHLSRVNVEKNYRQYDFEKVIV